MTTTLGGATRTVRVAFWKGFKLVNRPHDMAGPATRRSPRQGGGYSMPEPAANPGRLRVDPARGGGDGGDTQVQSSTIGGQCEIGNPNPQEMGGAAAGRGRKDGTYRGSDAGRETLRGGLNLGPSTPNPGRRLLDLGKGEEGILVRRWSRLVTWWWGVDARQGGGGGGEGGRGSVGLGHQPQRMGNPAPSFSGLDSGWMQPFLFLFLFLFGKAATAGAHGRGEQSKGGKVAEPQAGRPNWSRFFRGSGFRMRIKRLCCGYSSKMVFKLKSFLKCLSKWL
jgi:hypothetical protein